MTAALRLQYISVRTCIVDGAPLIDIKHTAQDADGAQVKNDRIEMPRSCHP